jgi:hypothetical protein
MKGKESKINASFTINAAGDITSSISITGNAKQLAKTIAEISVESKKIFFKNREEEIKQKKQNGSTLIFD